MAAGRSGLKGTCIGQHRILRLSDGQHSPRSRDGGREKLALGGALEPQRGRMGCLTQKNHLCSAYKYTFSISLAPESYLSFDAVASHTFIPSQDSVLTVSHGGTETLILVTQGV